MWWRMRQHIAQGLWTRFKFFSAAICFGKNDGRRAN